MAAPNKIPIGSLSLLIETETGVTEFFLRTSMRDGIVGLRADSARIVSGTFSHATPEQLMSAFQLDYWAKQNSAIFEEGRVVH